MSAKNVHVITGSNQEVISYLEELRTVDKSAERTWHIGCLFFLLAGGGVWGLWQYEFNVPSFYLIAVGILILIGLVLLFKGLSGDVDDARYEAVQRLHRYLSLDCHPETQYHYTLDLRSYTDRAFYAHTERFGGIFSMPKGKVKYYYCPTLSAQFRLLDGTSLLLTVERISRVITRTKRSYSGKTKTKIKTKYSDTFTVKVKLPDGPPVSLASPYSHKPPSQRFNAHKFKQKSKGQKLTVVGVEKNARANVNVDGLLQLLVSTFSQIHSQRSAAS